MMLASAGQVRPESGSVMKKIWSEITSINRLPLKMVRWKGGISEGKIVQETSCLPGDIYAFFDEKNLLRKIIIQAGCIDGSQRDTVYFRQDGSLLTIFTRSAGAGAGDFFESINSFWYKGTMKEVGSSKTENQKFSQGYIKTHLFPSLYKNAGMLRGILKSAAPAQTAGYRKYEIAAGHEYYISVSNAALRETPSQQAKALLTLSAVNAVLVTGKGPCEKIDPYGDHCWYRVEASDCSGWVYGAFIEPANPDAPH
jgi:hypothetical protein